ncbi:MAG: threonine synthase [Patescibacteria group bacterium]|jgi:threonine synthase
MVSSKGTVKFYRLRCVKCGTVWDEKETSSSCLKCGDALEAEYDWDFIKCRLNQFNLKYAPISATKYLNFYPILDLKKLVTLNEGGTPLRKSRKIAKRLGLENLYFKDETSNPTGGFKDRGTMVEITKALEMGAKAVVVASTGNMAASVSAYASQAGIPAYIVVPEGTPIGKLAQTLAYGARVIQVRATYSECAKLAEEIAKKYKFYLAGDYVFRGEGQKSQGYEIVEQLGWNAPDYLIVPVGCGTNIAAIYKGMREFYELGFINKLPKVIGVQPEGSNTIALAYREKTTKIKPIPKPRTIASAVAVGYPVDGLKVLRDIKESKGMALEVSDEEILKAEKELASEESIFVEPSAALPLAAVKMLALKGVIKKEETVVCVLTGNGLKDPVTMLKILPSPPSIEPNLSEVDHYLKMKLYNIQSTVEKDKVEVLFTKCPVLKKTEKTVKGKFGVSLDKKYLVAIQAEVENFFKKEDKMRKSDLQHIIESILKTDPGAKKIISVEDFNVSTSKTARAEAEVCVRVAGKRVCRGKSFGVGPVDAIMKAVREVIKNEKLPNYWLIDFDVKIDRKGTDASVEVTMGLKDEAENKVISTATSPDIIVASIEAFERAYNILCNKKEDKKK